MSSNSADVSVIIVSYNTRDLLAQCLNSLFKETPNLTVEVIVVDNASSDGSCELVRQQYPRVRIIANNKNVGFTKANNQAMGVSSGRYILLLNPDTVILDKSIERMVAFMDAHPGIGSCGCRLEYPDGTYQRSALPLPTVISAIYEYSPLFQRLPVLPRLLAPNWIDNPEKTRSVGYCTGACLLVDRSCIEQIGPMDENFFLYCEEVDWCKRMWEAGWPVVYLAECRVIHYEGASQKSSPIRQRRILQAEIQYLQKWNGLAYTRAYEAIVRACCAYYWLKLGWRVRRKPDERGLSEWRTLFRTILAGQVRVGSHKVELNHADIEDQSLK